MSEDEREEVLGSNVEAHMSLSFRIPGVYGFGSRFDFQKTFSSYPLVILAGLIDRVFSIRKERIDILRNLEGFLESGETLVVLGRPGSGCSTLLKTLAGQAYGVSNDAGSLIEYCGISSEKMDTVFRGRCTYQAETDVHFPHLTMRQTLEVASRSRNPLGLKDRSAENVQAEIAASLGLLAALDTKVGNEFVQGLSGGERKRTSIAEILASNTWLQCWDNSTRGLDSATAYKFVRLIRDSARRRKVVAITSLYQASQDMYNLMDKVLLLYEGRQIYFGPIHDAKAYFIALGFECPHRANEPDFLTSLTKPQARQIREGFHGRIPQTPDEFASIWHRSHEREELLQKITRYETQTSASRRDRMAKFQSIHSSEQVTSTFRDAKSPYMTSCLFEIHLLLVRCARRLKQDAGTLIGATIGNVIVSLILGSMFYNLDQTSDSFLGRAVLIFFGVVLNSNVGALEGTMLWEHRPIVEKHYRYGFYAPISEAIASMITDIPNKLTTTVAVNTPYYFLANLRRTPEAYFTFLLFAFMAIMAGSMIWRASGAMSRTLSESMPLGAAFSTLLTIYTGFIIPVPYMKPWLRWFTYLNPCYYLFESLLVNEFSNRTFTCSSMVPRGVNYADPDPHNRACTIQGAAPGSDLIDGDAYLAVGYQYYASHKWRNFGVVFALVFLFGAMYLVATKYIALERPKGEVLVIKKGSRRIHSLLDPEKVHTLISHDFDHREKSPPRKCESQIREKLSKNIHNATFMWENISLEIPFKKKGSKMILEDGRGWVEPGTLTALIGQTGAGKTSLLNVLAGRVTTGTVNGWIGVSQDYAHSSFDQKIGYAMQQDIHIPSATVREALEFSALLRQPASYSQEDKLAYVDTVIELLELEDFADAVIGVLGEGLNIEQRKRLTIGVELSARPELLVFLDEPTSGLDSDTAWSICMLLRKLVNSGQAILCTIHQPSSLVLEMFDNLLVLSKGKQVYFGEIGPQSRTLIDYFERGGATRCSPDQNPAEWLLSNLDSQIVDWPMRWFTSQERQRIIESTAIMKQNLMPLDLTGRKDGGVQTTASFYNQLRIVTKRAMVHDWRTPNFLWSKTLTTFLVAFINGISVWQAPNSIQGLQNQFFSLFVLFTIFSTHLQLILTRFIDMRALYEVRERPSRTYSWLVFVLSTILADLPGQTCMAVLTFLSWYFPLGWNHNGAQGSTSQRGGLTFFFVWMFMLWTQTFTQMIAAFVDNAPSGIALAQTMFILSLLFAGLLVAPSTLPRFWIFLYRASPMSYFVSGMMATATSGIEVECSRTEFSTLSPPSGQSCGAYLDQFLRSSNLNLENPYATDTCRMCPVKYTNTFLASYNIYWTHRWRDLGITIAFVVANICFAVLLYWFARLPKGAKGNAKAVKRL